MDLPIDHLRGYQDYFRRLLELERAEEINFHWNEILMLTGSQRERKGRAIMDLGGKDAGRGIGGIYLVRLSRGRALPETEIGIGDLVILSSGQPDGREAQAVVTEKGAQTITVAYNDYPPDYAYDRRLRLDLFANDVTFQRMFQALSGLRMHQRITDLLLLKQSPRVREGCIDPSFVQEVLNSSQKKAVIRALRSEDLFLIHGPPGTGKTTTLVEVILQHIRTGDHVLATADSNTAVDNMVEKLYNLGARVVRIGNPARLHPSLANVSLDHLLQEEDLFQQAAALRDQAFDLREEQVRYTAASAQNRRGLKDEQILRLAGKGAGSRGVSQDKIRKMAAWIKIQKKINALHEQIRKLERLAIENLIHSAEVVCATNATTGSELLSDIKFDVAVIDEATQSMEPSCLIPMTRAEKWVLAGDHKQLPPTVMSKEAAKLNHTVFERWMDAYGAEFSSLLIVQYRMNEKIMAFSNRAFYSGRLKASPKVKRHHIGMLSGFRMPDYYNEIEQHILDPEIPVVFIDVRDGIENQLSGSFSYFNKLEAAAVVQAASCLMSARLFPNDIGVISPYDQQVSLIRDLLEGTEIEVKTVDGFQGREKEVVIISLVRANSNGNLGFLSDYRRLNVAVTRARRKLVIIGNCDTLANDPVYEKLLDALPVVVTVNK